MKHSGVYMQHRVVKPGLVIAMDRLPEGRGVILARIADIEAAWEYESITAALAAWFAWNPEENTEPAGYTRRIDTTSKTAVEVL